MTSLQSPLRLCTLLLVIFLSAVCRPILHIAYAQDAVDPTSVPTTAQCDPQGIDCQFWIKSERRPSSAVSDWQIVAEDATAVPISVEVQQLPANILLLVDASNEMRTPYRQGIVPLAQFAGYIDNSEKMLSDTLDILYQSDASVIGTEIGEPVQETLSQILWSMSYIGAPEADQLLSWCAHEKIAPYCPPESDWQRSEYQLLRNAAWEIHNDLVVSRLNSGTPFTAPFAEAIQHLAQQDGTKIIICFCEGLDAGRQPDVAALTKLAADAGIRVYVKAMWKTANLDATPALAQLATQTGGLFVDIDEDVAPIWRAVAQDIHSFETGIRFAVPAGSEAVTITYVDASLGSSEWALPVTGLAPVLAATPTVQPTQALLTPTPPMPTLTPIPTRVNTPNAVVTPPPSETDDNGQGGAFDSTALDQEIDRFLQEMLGAWLPAEVAQWGSEILATILVLIVSVMLSSLVQGLQRRRQIEKTTATTARIDDGTATMVINQRPVTAQRPFSQEEGTRIVQEVLPVAKLKLHHAPSAEQGYALAEKTFYPNTLRWSIGRSAEALKLEEGYESAEPVVITKAPGSTVSRVHALIEYNVDIEGFVLTGDLTPNGTYVNRIKLEPLTPYPLRSGDEINFGMVAYEFEILETDLRSAYEEYASSVRTRPSDAEPFIVDDPDATSRVATNP